MKSSLQIGRRSTATRCMALLVGLHFKEGKRISREDLAHALRRSVRTVFAVVRRLEILGWIEVSGGGNGTPGLIRVINDLSWKTADVADVWLKTADDRPKTADVSPRIRAKEVLQVKERVPPSQSVENTEWEQLQAFAVANDLQICTGADMETALRLMRAANGAQDVRVMPRQVTSAASNEPCVPLAEMASESISGEVATNLPPPKILKWSEAAGESRTLMEDSAEVNRLGEKTGTGSQPGARLCDGEVQPGISPQATSKAPRKPPEATSETLRKRPQAECRDPIPWNAAITSLASQKRLERGFG